MEIVSRAQSAVPSPWHGEEETIVQEGEALRAAAFTIAGVACPVCSGYGDRLYTNTATWKFAPGVISGRAMTRDTCDVCWGTGRNDRTGVDLRKMTYEKH